MNKKTNKSFNKEIGEKANRMLRARSLPKSNVWFGLGMMGLIGWSVVVPTLLGALLGHWLDQKYLKAQVSWTLTCMILGMIIGCLNAWLWTSKENKEMHKGRDDNT